MSASSRKIPLKKYLKKPISNNAKNNKKLNGGTTAARHFYYLWSY